jgi:protein QN1
VASEHLLKLEKELEAQERIIQGYQKENERLLAKLREKEVENQQTKQTLFKEHQRLGMELNNSIMNHETSANTLR